jgi:hypothetical protein
MVHPPGLFFQMLEQGAAQGHVQFLKTPADGDQRTPRASARRSSGRVVLSRRGSCSTPGRGGGPP